MEAAVESDGAGRGEIHRGGDGGYGVPEGQLIGEAAAVDVAVEVDGLVGVGAAVDAAGEMDGLTTEMAADGLVRTAATAIEVVGVGGLV